MKKGKIHKVAEWLGIVQKQDADGKEIIDGTPLALPSGFRRPETLQEQVRRLVRSEKMDELANSEGVETWDEANDFDIDDDFDPSSPWETIYDPDLEREISPREYQEQFPAIKKELEVKLRNAYRLEEVEKHEREFLARMNTRGERGDSPAPGKPAEQSPAQQNDASQ